MEPEGRRDRFHLDHRFVAGLDYRVREVPGFDLERPAAITLALGHGCELEPDAAQPAAQAVGVPEKGRGPSQAARAAGDSQRASSAAPQENARGS